MAAERRECFAVVVPHRRGDMVGPSPLAPLLRTTFAAARLNELTDGELLARFVAARDDSAFAELVRRLGPTVYGVCRRVLGRPEDAEDAFQVVFLVLARKAGTVRPPGRVAAWLHGVAAFVARKARTARGRRRSHESAAPPPASITPPEPDLVGVIDAELNLLPERLRLPVVLCEVRGLTIARAARELGWPAGTVASRLSRGRDALADRLTRRGLAVGAVGGLAVVPPARLVAVTLSLMTPGGALPAAATSLLLREVTRAMTTTRLTVRLLVASVLAAVTGLAIGVGGLSPAPAAPVPVAKRKEAPEMTPAMVDLLTRRAVLRELGCTPEQRAALEDDLDQQAAERDADLAALMEIIYGGRKGAGAEPAMKAFQQKEEAAPAARIEQAKRVLKTGQIARLAEVELQVRGVAAFTDPKVADVLKLTDEQSKGVQAAVAQAADVKNARPKSDGLVVGPGGVEGLRLVGYDGSGRAKAYRVVEDSLTEGQLKAWRGMTGEPVKFDPFALK